MVALFASLLGALGRRSVTHDPLVYAADQAARAMSAGPPPAAVERITSFRSARGESR